MMTSLMLKRLSPFVLRWTRGSCISCFTHSLSLQHQPPAHHTFMVPSTNTISTKMKCSQLSTQSYTLIYRLPYIKLFKAVSRLKLLQTGITLVILPPVYYFYLQGVVSLFLVGYSSGIALFAGVMLYVASHFLRRVVGLMYVDSTQTTLKVSHLTFWGKRSDLFIPVSDVMTIADTGDSTSETILKLKTYSSPQTFYFSPYYGNIVDKVRFEKVFGKLK